MTNLDAIHAKHRQGDRQGALNDLIALIRIEPNHTEAWMFLAELVDEPERKRECYRRVLQIDPGHLGAGLSLAGLEQAPTTPDILPPAEPPRRVIDAAPADPKPIANLRSDLVGKPPLVERIIDATDRAINRVVPARHQKTAGYVALGFIVVLVGLIVFMFLGDQLLPLRTAATGVPTQGLAAQITGVPSQPPTAAATATPSPAGTAQAPAPENLGPKELRVYYAQEAALWCWREGTATPLTVFENEIRQVKLSRDNRQTGMAADQALWLVDCPGAEVKPLVESAQIAPALEDPKYEGSRYYPRYLDWSPDGQFIYFDTINTSDQGRFPNNDLYRVELSSGALTQLLSYDQGGQPYVSPDGLWVASASARFVSLARVDGSGWVRVMEFAEHPPLTWESDSPPVVWMPDSSAFLTAVSVEEAASETFGKVYTVFRVAVLDGSAEALGRFTTSSGAIDFSPDGRFLVYRAGGDPELPFGVLRLAEVSGATDSPIAQEKPLQFAGWAPHSSGFAYVLEEDQQLYYAEAFGSEGIPMLTGELLPQPYKGLTWLDDQHFFLFTGSGLYSGEVGRPLELLVPGDPGDTRILAVGYQ